MTSSKFSQRIRPNWIKLLISIIILLVLGLSGGYLYILNKTSQSQQSLLTTPTSVPKPLGSHGKTTFTIGGGNITEPQFSQGYLDPYDPKQNGKQTVSIMVSYTQPVTRVQATLKTDHKAKIYPLTLVSGTPTNGRWEGTWTVSDSYFYTYNMDIQAESGSVSSRVELTLR